MKRTRLFVFTVNNYSDEDIVFLENILQYGVKYVIFGKEVAPSTLTPHLQGALYFNNRVTCKQVSNLLKTAHIESANGTFDEVFEYCKKENNWFEYGEKPLSSIEKGFLEQDRWSEAKHLALQGNISDIDPQIYIAHYNSLKAIMRDNLSFIKDLDKPCGIWIQGLSGCGKSTRAREMAPLAYTKPLNKWWDGYLDEEDVILDDVDKTHQNWIGHFLKYWTDKWAFIGEMKGTSRRIRPKRFIITSQYMISQIFSDEETVSALQRRCEVIDMFN